MTINVTESLGMHAENEPDLSLLSVFEVNLRLKLSGPAREKVLMWQSLRMHFGLKMAPLLPHFDKNVKGLANS